MFTGIITAVGTIAALQPRGGDMRLRIATGTDRLDPKPGWTLTSLVNPATRREPATSPGAKVPEADPAVAPKLPD